MKGVFEFIVKGELKTFYDYRDIPDDFDHVIKFVPEIPDGPHSHDQHEEIDRWNHRLQELVAKEKAKNGF